MLCRNWNLICKYNRHSKSHEFLIFYVFVVANKLQKIFLTIIVQSHSAFICVWLIFFHFLGSGGLIYTTFFSRIILDFFREIDFTEKAFYICVLLIFFRSWVLAWIYTSLTMILYVVFLALVHLYQLWTNFHLSRLNMKG